MSPIQRSAGRFGVAAAILIAALIPMAAPAQDVPSYAVPAAASADETIHGRIRSVDGAFLISVDDDRGFVDSVQLHGGTIINPTGLTLSAGMSVTIFGYNGGSSFEANEIDTPYTYAGPVPAPVYYGPGYWCPGFAYGYGPAFSLAIVIGGGGWSYEHRPFYGRPWNGSRYFGAAVGVASLDRARIPERRDATARTFHDSYSTEARSERSYLGEGRNQYTQEVRSERFNTTAAAPQTSRGYGRERAPSESARGWGGDRAAARSTGGGHSGSAPRDGGHAR